jgi:prevent-host-death family protein
MSKLTYSIEEAKDQLSRLLDEALNGHQVTITRSGKPVVGLHPIAAVGHRITAEEIEWLRRCRERLPSMEIDTITEIRAMRDDF